MSETMSNLLSPNGTKTRYIQVLHHASMKKDFAFVVQVDMHNDKFCELDAPTFDKAREIATMLIETLDFPKAYVRRVYPDGTVGDMIGRVAVNDVWFDDGEPMKW
jgi:hypothetical protein